MKIPTTCHNWKNQLENELGKSGHQIIANIETETCINRAAQDQFFNDLACSPSVKNAMVLAQNVIKNRDLVMKGTKCKDKSNRPLIRIVETHQLKYMAPDWLTDKGLIAGDIVSVNDLFLEAFENDPPANLFFGNYVGVTFTTDDKDIVNESDTDNIELVLKRLGVEPSNKKSYMSLIYASDCVRKRPEEFIAAPRVFDAICSAEFRPTNNCLIDHGLTMPLDLSMTPAKEYVHKAKYLKFTDLKIKFFTVQE